jgi:hypothetical protein
MKMNIEDFTKITIRARAAFVLLIADSLMPELRHEGEGYIFALKAFEITASWINGKDVSGDELNDLLMNHHDQGIFAYVDNRKQRVSDRAYTVLGGAISYVAWHAYRTNKLMLPDGIQAVTEHFVQWLIDEASKSPSFGTHLATRIWFHLFEHFKIHDDDELGSPVNLNELKKIVNQ